MLSTCINDDDLTVAEDATIYVRIDKQDHGGEDVRHSWHRCMFTPGCNAQATMDLVDAHLEQMAYGAVPAADWNKVRALIAQEHTNAVIVAYQEKIAAADAAREAARA